MRFLAMMILVGLIAASVHAGDYWPVNAEGVTYVFVDAAADTIRIDFPEPGSYTYHAHGCHDRWDYQQDASGVHLGYVHERCDGGWDAQWSSWDPPLSLLRYPLIAGASWSINGWTAVVLEPDTVTVPYGQFEVTPLWIMSGAWQPFHNLSGTIYLDEDLGPVKIDDYELVSIEGVVVTEAQTWSEVKSLFR